MKTLCPLLLAGAIALAQPSPPFRARVRPAAPAGGSMPAGKPVTIPAPLGLPPVPFPADNPPTAETIALGHRLFFDKLLSRDGTVACASCHLPKAAMADPRPVSLGVNGGVGGRNAPSILNAAYHDTQFWDGRARSLEEQAAMPVPDGVEMAHSLTGVERRLAANPAYVKLFAKAFGPGRITFEMAAKAIASYERTLLSGNSPFDRYQFGGDKKALSEAAIRGLALFSDATLDGPNCISCHRIEDKFATFTESRFHNSGVAWDEEKRAYKDKGRIAVTGTPKDAGAFKAVTLRNITLTAPYMHDGSMQTLEEVLDFYFEGGRRNPLLSGVMPHHGVPNIPKAEQAQAKADLVEFLKALTGDMPAGAAPPGPVEAKR